MRRALSTALALTLLSALAGTALAGNGGVPADGDNPPPAPAENHLFPITAKHSYGDGFGAGRGHMGQDIFARCGKNLRAARGGRVEYRAFQRSAGHYIVINGKGTPRDYAYLHLMRRSPLDVGDRVTTGQFIGKVGDTGNASGCHLHFELWRGDWNGRPDVTRKLQRWDKYS